MSKVLITDTYLEDIADAIRDKLDTEDTYTPGEMAAAVGQIHGEPVLQAKTANANGTVTPDTGYEGMSSVIVNVPNTYAQGDEGKVVSGGALVSQTSRSITANGTVDTTLNNEVVVNVPTGGGGSTLITKNITANGEYNASADNADGYSKVTVAVPNTYTASDEGKVVSSGALTPQTSKNVTVNGTYNTTTNNEVVVNVPTGGSSPTLVAKSVTANGSYDPTDDNADGYSGVTVNVPNTYTASDEGKVVSSGALVAQTARTVDANGAFNTTQNNLVTVNVPKINILGKLGGSEAAINARVLGPMGSSTDDYLVPLDANGDEITLSNIQPYEINVAFMLTQDNGINSGDTIYIMGGRYDSGAGAWMPVVSLRRNGNSLIMDARINIAELSFVACSSTILLSSGDTPFGKWMVANIKYDTDRKYKLRFTFDATTSNAETSEATPDTTATSVPIVGSNNGAGGNAHRLCADEGALIDLERCYIAQNGVTIWQATGTQEHLLQAKTVTENGTVMPDSGYYGLSSVVVNVESGGISGVYKSSGAPASSLGNDGDIYIRTYDLPSNVNFVEYLQGDGNAYIDTGITADVNTGAYAKFEVTGGYPVFCARYSASSRTYGIICVDSGATLSLDMDTARMQSPTAIGNVVEAKMNRFIKEKNGTTIGITNPGSFTTPANVTLFAINATNSYGLVVSPSKIHRVVFTENGVVTHDFLPALDGNGVACMYESISGTYFYNKAASGSFSYGNTVTPEEAEPTIYMKANGVWKVITQIGAV